jgi:hypothetical protein
MNNEHKVSLTVPTKKRYANVLEFKIILCETKPVVSRVIHVPESYTFYDLHVAIQDAMGWGDYHLWAFRFKQGAHCPYGNEVISPWYEKDGAMDRGKEYATEVPLMSHFAKEGDAAYYTYDYGDDWNHRITLTKIVPREKGVTYPRCISGKMACPPEDCGSIPGYCRCKELVAEPRNIKDSDDKDLLEWLGEDWDPNHFDPQEVYFEDPYDRFMRHMNSIDEH